MQPTDYPNVPQGELPHPQQDQAPLLPMSPDQNLGQPIAEQQQARSIEQATALPAPLMPAPSQGVAPALPLNQTVLPTAQGTNASPHSPIIADDADLIEKEWVAKAKHIVEQTKEDPYIQTKEISKMKADYLKKRYAKELKLTED